MRKAHWSDQVGDVDREEQHIDENAEKAQQGDHIGGEPPGEQVHEAIPL